MKTNKRFHHTASGKEAAVTNNEVFAKQKLQRTKLTWKSILFAVILTLIAIGCKEAAAVQPPTTKALSFGTNCKVTIKSDEAFTDAEWNTLCDKVVAAIEGTRGYNKAGNTSLDKLAFENIFATRSISVILSNSAVFKCEVKAGNNTTIYIKTSAIDTVDFRLVVGALTGDNGGVYQEN